MPERGPDAHLESKKALPLLTALTMIVAACSANVSRVTDQPQLPTAKSHATENPANAPSPKDLEAAKTPLQQLEETKRDLEEQIIIFKREIGRFENIERTKKGGLDTTETATLLTYRRLLDEAQSMLATVNSRIGLHRKLDEFIGPDNGESIWGPGADDFPDEE